MSDTVENGYMVYKPTRRERFWRAMGFRYHHGDGGDGTEPRTGWMKTETRMKFDLADRLRLLLTGELRMSHTIDMDTPSPGQTFTRFDWRIVPPGDRP